jgi:hypothetical protein
MSKPNSNKNRFNSGRSSSTSGSCRPNIGTEDEQYVLYSFDNLNITMATQFKMPNLNNYFMNVRNLDKGLEPSSLIDDSILEPLERSKQSEKLDESALQ